MCAADRIDQSANATADAASLFVERALPLAGGHVFDVGVADVNGDGWLDIFTSNHASRHTVLVNDGRRGFTDIVERIGLNLDPAFPGWDDAGWVDTVDPANMSEPGLYIYRRHEAVVLRLVTPDPNAIVHGRIEFLCAVKVYQCEDIAVTMTRDEAAGSSDATWVEFTAIGGRACLVLLPILTSLSITVVIAGDWPLSRVHVGHPPRSPLERRFALRLQDRHGMAWADYNGDGRPELFVARGGLKGRIEEFEGRVADELFVNRGTRVDNVIRASGLKKCGCRSRQAGWVDFDSDGRLDLFVSCERDGPRLYWQEPSGTFTNVSMSAGLHEIRGDCFTWIDVDGDGAPELLAARGCELLVFRRGLAGRFVRDHAVRLCNMAREVRRLAIADFDGDGAPDIFAPAADGNTLLVNEHGVLRAVEPSAVGLPATCGLTASWVDFDNDGLTDLHVIPGGLFRQQPNGRFSAMDGVDGLVPSPVRDARVIWFDATNNGARDALVAYQPVSATMADFQWRFALYENRVAKGHWLQIELDGLDRNRPAIGGAVTIVAAGRAQTQWVGTNDGSHYSQGHYRLYFGLGREPEATAATVRWPDGYVQGLGPVRADQILRIHRR